ncbi:MAG: hypothetical protein JWL65_4597 [Gammaproteobacteria bacterium]|nr:hypothetical protein [Gammaproteobacteria bacterium]
MASEDAVSGEAHGPGRIGASRLATSTERRASTEPRTSTADSTPRPQALHLDRRHRFLRQNPALDRENPLHSTRQPQIVGHHDEART